MTDAIAGAVSAATIRPMRQDDRRSAAQLHSEALPHGYFPLLGPRFLSAYLASFGDDPSGVALVADVDGRVDGFVVGTTDAAGRRAHVVRRHGGRLAVIGVVALLGRPALGVRFVRRRAVRYVRAVVRGVRDRGSGGGGDVGPCAVLAHVAVQPHARGTRTGRALVEAFARAAADAGCGRAVLVTRHADAGAGRFYEHLGWRRTRSTDDRDGMRWDHYELSLR